MVPRNHSNLVPGAADVVNPHVDKGGKSSVCKHFGFGGSFIIKNHLQMTSSKFTLKLDVFTPFQTPQRPTPGSEERVGKF